MILEIVKCGHPVLRTKGKSIAQVSPEIRQLAADMTETMYTANGVGLAAQQVGQTLMLAVIDVSQSEHPSELWIDGKTENIPARMPLVFLNPRITRTEGDETSEEGCLSVPEITAAIHRAARVTIQANNLDGKTLTIEATGLLARAIQHEIDHLNGILFIDRMDPATRVTLSGKIKKLTKETKSTLKQTKSTTRRASILR